MIPTLIILVSLWLMFNLFLFFWLVPVRCIDLARSKSLSNRPSGGSTRVL
jgi:hypothetical protein